MNETIQVLINEVEIQERLLSLSEEIKKDYAERPFIMLCALTGGVIFLADLSRHMGDRATIDFVRVSSYGDKTETSGTISLDCHPKLDIKGKEVLIIEDIIDTGHTLFFLKKYLQEKGAAVVRTCALLDKPSRREVDIAADYVGFTIPDKFVVGYGLDYAQRYRTLPYVGVLSFK